MENTSKLEGKTVADFIRDNGGWDTQKLCYIFYEELAQFIITFKIFSKKNIDSHKSELSKIPLGKSITTMVYASHFNDTKGEFEWLQALKFHPREKFFLWRLILYATSTFNWLHSRGYQEEEHIEHFMIFCTLTKSVLQVLARWGFLIPIIPTQFELKGALMSSSKNYNALAKAYFLLSIKFGA